MKKLPQVVAFLLAVLIVSCQRRGLVDGSTVVLARPDSVVELSPDADFNADFPEVLHCFNLKIVNDTLLVLHDIDPDTSQDAFKVYSVDSYEFLGSFMKKGRGPGEMASPQLLDVCAEERYLGVSDNSLSLSWLVDVAASIEAGHTVVLESMDHPSSLLDWIPLSESSQLMFCIDSENFVYHVTDADGKASADISPYSRVTGEMQVVKMSSLLTGNQRVGEVAVAMVCFPQIDLFSLKDGSARTIAVSEDYVEWETTVNSSFGMDSMEYYNGLTSDDDHIFATYLGLPISERMQPGHGASIHVFDWSGDFICEIKVKEDISKLAFDRRTKKLYSVDTQSGQLVRYDLSSIL